MVGGAYSAARAWRRGNTERKDWNWKNYLAQRNKKNWSCSCNAATFGIILLNGSNFRPSGLGSLPQEKGRSSGPVEDLSRGRRIDGEAASQPTVKMIIKGNHAPHHRKMLLVADKIISDSLPWPVPLVDIIVVHCQPATP